MVRYRSRRSQNEVNDRLISGSFLLAVVILVVLIVGYGTWPKPHDFLVNLWLEPEQNETKQNQAERNQPEQHREGDVIEQPKTTTAMLTAPPGTKAPNQRTPAAMPPTTLPAADVRNVLNDIRPEGVHIDEVIIEGQSIKVEGYAANNQAVARFLRAIDQQVGEPKLNMVKQEQRNQQSVSRFSIVVKQVAE